MADDLHRGDFYQRLYLLQKRLKGERLFIRQDKEIISKLNDNVLDTCTNVYHLAWTTRQHWRNVDRLVSGTRVFTSDCSKSAARIEETLFEDASKHLGYQDAKYGEFLLSLRENPKLVAIVLNLANKLGVDITNLTRILLLCLYGSCLMKEDENYVLSVLRNLMDEQILVADDVMQYFCGPKSYLNAFPAVLRLYTELLFSSKLYLTAALHGAVMQIIVDDSVFLDLNMNKVLSRLSPRAIQEKFGDPGTPTSKRRMLEHIEVRQQCLINLINKFLKSLKDKIYSFPTGLKWILRELYFVINKRLNDEKRTTAIVGHVLMNFFICPAIINPEPYGVNSDAFISEAARYNLGQVASIFRSLALAECGMKDIKMEKLLQSFGQGIISSFVNAVLQDADQLNPLNEKEPVEGLKRSAVLITENELKALIHFMKKMQTEDCLDLKNSGIDQLIDLLPPLPRRWSKPNLSLDRNATSLPITMQLKANPDLVHPGSFQKNTKMMKKTNSLFVSGSVGRVSPDMMKEITSDQNQTENPTSKEEYDNILSDLSSMIKDNEVVLVISFGFDQDNQPGTLSEDKILGLKDGPMQNTTLDIATDEERQRRASSIIQDAMKDLEGLKILDSLSESTSFQALDTESFDNSSFEQSAFSSTIPTPNLTPMHSLTPTANLMPTPNSTPSASVMPTPNSTPSASVMPTPISTPLASVMPTPISTPTPKSGNLLIDFDDGAKTPNTSNILDNDVWSSTPSRSNVANNSLLEDGFNAGDSQQSIVDDPFTSKNTNAMNNSLNPFAADVSTAEQKNNGFVDLDIPADFNEFNDRSKSSAPFFVNRSATLSPSKRAAPDPWIASNSTSLNRTAEYPPMGNKEVTPGSLLGSLNTILQKPVIPTPTSLTCHFKFDETHEEFGGEKEKCDLINKEENVNSSDSEDSSAAEDARTDSPQLLDESKSHDSGFVGVDNEAKSDARKRQLVMQQEDPATARAKEEALKQLKKEAAENERQDRRKSSSGWLKGKLATGKDKLKSVKYELKNRTKSDGQNLKKTHGQRIYRKMTAPQTELKANIEINDGAPVSNIRGGNQAISEEIMNKYRNISSNPGLMEEVSHGENSDVTELAKETEFDEDFKFDDAKRKLRIVLCMADRSNFPSGASDCFQLLMTFLLAQLAEAINLEDRSVVAQLHETLRSIRQLPKESCEKLLDALEDDYRKRSTYVSYLVRSKQALLATLSHLEQIRKKVERDKAICSKYFTTICVRLFLETPDKKKEIAQFAQKFEVTKMVDEKCALLEDFLESLYREMSTDPTWVAAPNQNWQDAKCATERIILSKIYKAAFYPNGMQDIENDKIFHEHIKRLSEFITVNHQALQIRKIFQKEAPWPSAQTELLMINAYKTPADKLRCIHRCCIAIMNLLSMATPNQTSGADEFVPVLVYVLIRANAPNLLSTKQYINTFYGNRLGGEEFYCWTQFCAAAEFVKSLDERSHVLKQ